MRLLTHLPGRAKERIEAAYPEVEVVEVAPDGDVGELGGDALLATPFATNTAQLAPRVQWLHSFGTGVDGLPDEAFAVPLLTCSRGAGAVPISEFVLAAMLAFEKQLPDVWVHAPPEQWARAKLGGLRGRALGLVGLGGIGERVARLGVAFGMTVTALRRRPLPSPVLEVAIASSLEEVLAASDHLVLAAPLTGRTQHLLDAWAFEMVKPGVHLVNIARGGLVDQDALRAALDDGRVAMASLDVASPEPPPEGHWLYSHPRVRLSPHVSWSSPEQYSRIFELFLDDLGRYLRGEPLEGVVDPVERY